MRPSIEQQPSFVNTSHNPSNPRANVEPGPTGFHPRIHKQYMRWIASLLGVVGIFISFNPETLWAATIAATSCSRNDIGAAVDSAENGDTVLIPAGNCTWTTNLTIKGKYLTIQGAGVGQTIITDGVSKAVYPNIPQALVFSTIAEGLSRLTGITFQGGAINDGYNKGIVIVGGTSHTFRVDHCQFIPTQTSGLFIYGDVWGVIDHNLFDLSAHHGFGLYIHGIGYGDESWARGSTLGTQQNVFVEDNVFTQDESHGFHYYGVDGWMGSRVVVRHNQFNAVTLANHGTETGGRWRSQRQFEIYNNTWTWDMMGNAFPDLIGLRGGTGVIYNNTATISNGSINEFIGYEYYRAAANYYIWGQCPSIWDLSSTRCLDQTGVGRGDLLSGDTPTPSGWPHQISDPAYDWNNLINGVPSNAVSHRAAVVKENRDLFHQIKPGYTPYTYPHPLVTSSDTTNDPPITPKNLNVR